MFFLRGRTALVTGAGSGIGAPAMFGKMTAVLPVDGGTVI